MDCTVPSADLFIPSPRNVNICGVNICIRPLRPDEQEKETDFLNSLSEESRYFRLMSYIKIIPPDYLGHLTDIDYIRRMAFVATIAHEAGERMIGVARYAATDKPWVAELGVSVADEWQRHGVATLLLSELARHAHRIGFRTLEGYVLPNNMRMLELIDDFGFSHYYDSQEHAVRVVLALGESCNIPDNDGHTISLIG